MTTSEIRPDLGTIQTLPEFLETTGGLIQDDMVGLVNQALVLIDDLYAHLPLKRAMHAVDPVQRPCLAFSSKHSVSVHRRSLQNHHPTFDPFSSPQSTDFSILDP